MRTGFTLSELLVVIAIIAVLATMMVPVAQSVRRAAVATACGSNLRQVGIGFLAYAEDHEGQFPADSRLYTGITAAQSDAWYDRLPDYLDVPSHHRVFQCAGYRAPTAPTVQFATAPKSFKMNDYLDSSGRQRYFIPAQVRDAAALLLMVDAVAGISGMGQWSRAVTSGVTDSRHCGRINLLAADAITVMQRQVTGTQPGNGLPWLSSQWTE